MLVLLQFSPATVVVFVALALFLLFFLIFLAKYVNLWIRALFTRAEISLFQLVGMSLRKVNAAVIVNSKIRVIQAGLTITTQELEGHYLAGGNVPMVVAALIAADRAGIKLDFRRAAAIDLAGRNILEAIKTSVNPKVIDVPGGNGFLTAMAKNGIELKVRARVTVRTNIAQLVGGATEETIIARVGEGIISTIGSSTEHREVLENPDRISKTVLAKGLDSGTAFEILSIDIGDVDVGQNIGSKLQIDQAQADKQVAQAMAEQRKAMALARTQEMTALVEENRAKLVEAESQVPQAIAEAFRKGLLGIMDYYRLKNVQADTSMREAIGGGGGGAEPSRTP